MKKTQTVLKYFFNALLAIAGTIFAIIAIFSTPIIFVLVSSIFYSYWLIIIVAAKIKLPKARILRKFDSLCTFGEIYTSTEAYSTLQFALEGHVEIETVKKHWTELILNKTDSKGNPKFPELQEHFENFGGYSFRRWDKDFDIDNHFHLHEENHNEKDIIDKRKLIEIRKKFQKTFFPRNRSPWEILIVNNYRCNNSLEDPECSIFIFKYHHVLGDLFAIIHVFTENLAVKPIEVSLSKTERPKVVQKKRMSLKSIILPIRYAFQFPFLLIYNTSTLFNARNVLQIQKFEFQTKYELWQPEPIDRNIVREIRSTYSVSSVSVLVTVITGAMRRMLLAKDLTLPEITNVVVPTVLPNHPGGFKNYANVIDFQVALASTDFKGRLQATERRIKKSSLGLMPLATKFCLPFGEAIPCWIRKGVIYESFTSLFIPCMSFPFGDATFFGHRMLSCDSVINISRSKAGFMVNVLGYQDHFYLTLQVDASLLSDPEEVKDFEKYILEELDLIGKSCAV